MKRYNDLYPQIYDRENVYQAYKKASKRKSHYAEVIAFRKDVPGNIDKIVQLLKNKQYKNAPYQIFSRVCGVKTRLIYKLPFMPDRIVHHAICQVMEPIWNKQYIRDTYSCIKGRGIHGGVNRVKSALIQYPKETTYCYKMDINKYFPSIDNEIMKSIIRRKIKCNDTLNLLDEIIDSEKGLPIGNYLSQHLSNLYLSGFDHFVKEKLRVKHYFRYCDDIVILGGSKEMLRPLHDEIVRYLREGLNLSVKSNWQIFPVEARGIDFLGYRFFRNYTLVRKRIVKKMKKRLREIQKHKAPEYSSSVRSTLASYSGWLKYANSHNLTQNLIKRYDYLPEFF